MHVFACCALVLLILVILGRMPELLPVLSPLRLGLLAPGLALLAVFALNPRKILIFCKETPMGKGMLFLLVWAFAGLPFSVWSGGTFIHAKLYFFTVLLSSLIVGLAAGERYGMHRIALLLTALLLSVNMVLSKGTGRLQVGGSYDPNDIALLFIILIPLVVSEALQDNKMMRIVAWVVFVCSVVSVALTGSRGGLLGLAAMGAQAFWMLKRRRWLLLPVLALGAGLFVYTADDNFWDRMTSISDDSDYNLHADTGRIAIWKKGIMLMLGRPLFGVGLGQFDTAMGGSEGGVWLVAHNSFVQVGSELGIPGLGVFLAMLFSIYRLSRKGEVAPYLAPKERMRFLALRVSLTGYCTAGFFLSQAFGSIASSLWALSAVMFLHLRDAERKAKAEERAAEEQLEGEPVPEMAAEGLLAHSASPLSPPVSPDGQRRRRRLVVRQEHESPRNALTRQTPAQADAAREARSRQILAQADAAREAKSKLLRQGDELVRKDRQDKQDKA